MTTPEYNENSCVSGGFVFDQMDRLAHDTVKKFTDKKYVFTKAANICFHKQICDWSDTEMDTSIPYAGKAALSPYLVTVYVCKKDTTDVLASCDFIFIAKDHAYCTTKDK